MLLLHLIFLVSCNNILDFTTSVLRIMEQLRPNRHKKGYYKNKNVLRHGQTIDCFIIQILLSISKIIFNGCRLYVNFLTWEKLFVWAVHSVGGEGIGVKMLERGSRYYSLLLILLYWKT